VITTTAATARRYASIVENVQNLLRPRPRLNVDFFAHDPARRFHYFLVPTTASTEVALSVRWRLHTDCSSPQVCNVAKELDWTLPVAILHLTIRRTHAAQGLDSAFNTLCNAGAL
jgi:hypothetical protein